MNISEENLVSWSKGPGQTEADKCSNAETAVRRAIKASEQLAALDVSVFAQGSYSARTNVRQNSDVDICVRYNATFFTCYPDGMSRETVGNVPGTMAFADCMVQKALEDYFGEGNKAGSSQGSVQLWPVPWLISQTLSSTYVAGEHRLYLERNAGSRKIRPTVHGGNEPASSKLTVSEGSAQR